MEFPNVTARAAANVYFDGRVVSHTILLPDGSKKTLGVILPGEFYFNTSAPERMDIIAGRCEVVIDGTNETLCVDAGSSFEVPGDSGFAITVTNDVCQYVCTFL